jgi:ketopantoate reductase
MTRIAVFGAGGVGGYFGARLARARRLLARSLHGFVVRRAAQHALAVPMSEAVYAILQPWAIRNQGEAGS